MDESGAIGILATIAIVAVVGVVGTGAVLYAADFALEADIQDTECSIPVVTVKTAIGGIEHDVTTISADQCVKLAPGDRAVYHIRTKHTTIYRAGVCFYDTETGTLCGKAAGPGNPNGLGLL